MRPIQELPIEDLWRFVCVQFAKNVYLWALLRLDVARFLELKKLAVTAGKIPADSGWERVEPDEELDEGPLWRRRPGEQVVLVRKGEVIVELPSNGRELKDARPRGRPGAPLKLTDDVLKQHLRDHPDVSHARRAQMLTHALKLQSRPLHRETIARRVRALKKR